MERQARRRAHGVGLPLPASSILPIPPVGPPSPVSAPGRRGRFREEQPDPATTWARAPSPRRAQPREGDGRLLCNENCPLRPRRTRASGQNSGPSPAPSSPAPGQRPRRDRPIEQVACTCWSAAPLPRARPPPAGILRGGGQRPPSGRLSPGPQAESMLPGPSQSAEPPQPGRRTLSGLRPVETSTGRWPDAPPFTWAQGHSLPVVPSLTERRSSTAPLDTNRHPVRLLTPNGSQEENTLPRRNGREGEFAF